METLKRLWRTRDELSIRNIRFSKWNCAFIFAVAVVLTDLHATGINGAWSDISGTLFGLDYYTLQGMAYGLGVLIFAFVPRSAILNVMRISGVLSLAALICVTFVPLSGKFASGVFFQFTNGLCVASAACGFFFILNNTERLADLVIIALFYVFFVRIPWEGELAQFFIGHVLSYVLLAFFVLCTFTIKQDALPHMEVRSSGGCKSHSDCCKVGGGGIGVMFFLYIVYMIVFELNRYIVYTEHHVIDTLYAIGAFAAIVIVLVAMWLFSKSAWHVWNIFIVAAILSVALIAHKGESGLQFGSGLFGLADLLGFMTILYLIGGAANLSGCIKYFRMFCVVEFFCNFALVPVLDPLFESFGKQNNITALGLMIVIACVTLAMYPTLQKKVFESDWIDNLNTLSPEKFTKELEHVAEQDRTSELGLTPREKQIFTLLLTDMSVKQIMLELRISRGTFNFHTSNLYRKLEIQSRTELFVKYSTEGKEIAPT